jgi:glycosyltransferase involved in cell wall biosynthesis
MTLRRLLANVAEVLPTLSQILRLHAKNLPRKALRVWSQEGWKGLLARAADVLRRERPITVYYPEWIRLFDTPTERARLAMRADMDAWPTRPLISIIMPVYDTDLRWLGAAIRSVQAQLYPNWELCISDDASTREGLRDMLQDFARQDHRIRVHLRDSNGNISVNSNSALSLAGGEFVALMDADDTLSPDALYWIAREIAMHPDADLIFSDEDKIDEQDRRFDPNFKPDWNPALMLAQNAFGHLGAFRRSLIRRVGGFRKGFEGSQDHDLVLRCAEQTSPARIRHIPRILYHWRAIESSTALRRGVKPEAWKAGQRAIEEHLTRLGLRASVRRAPLEQYQVEYEPPLPSPHVSVLIPTTGNPALLGPCLDALLSRTTYPDFEVLLLVNEIQRGEFLGAAAERPRIRVLFHPDRPFNYSWVNNWGASEASGGILCLLNDDTEVITPDWLERLATRAMLPGVGAVGAMMYYPDDTIQHAGVILGLGAVAGHAFHGLPRGSSGYFSRACLEQDLSCVTAGCLAIRRDVFHEVGRFSEQVAVAFNDVDFCIRLRQTGRRVIWTPTVELYHRESASVGRHDSPQRARKFAEEKAMLRKLWGPTLDADPFYNLNLSLDRAFNLAFPPRTPSKN